MNLNDLKNRLLILTGIIVSGFLLLLFDSTGIASKLYDVSASISNPVRLTLTGVNDKFANMLGALTKITQIQEENENLRSEYQAAFEKLSELEELKAENENLKVALGIRDIVSGEVIEGRVIGVDITFSNTLLINIGTKAGVEVGDIVTVGKFAIGEVKETNSLTSKILLVSSPESRIPSRGEVNRAIGLVEGKMGKTLEMKEILPDENVDIGEIVVTSGINSSYPPGLILGKVTSVKDNPAQATKEATLELQIDLSRLDYIYVIKGQD